MKPEFLKKFLGCEKITLVDVGAAGGIDRLWRKLGYFLQVITFEPDERGSSVSLHTSQRFHTTNFNTALGEKNQKTDFHLTVFPAASSIFKPDYDFLKSFPCLENHRILETKQLQLRPLTEVLKEAGVTDVDFIKLDTQGADLMILKGADEIVHSHVFGIQVEVEFNPTYISRPSFGEIDSHLHSRGFALFNLRREFWKRNQKIAARQTTGQLIWADALYLRTIESLKEVCHRMTPLKAKTFLRKACVISFLYGYIDYASEIIGSFKDSLLPESETQELMRWIAQYTPHRLKLPIKYDSTLLGKAHRFFAYLVWKFYRAVQPHIQGFILYDLE